MFRAPLCFFLLFFALSVPDAFSDPVLDVSLQKSALSLDETTELSLQIEWPKSEATYSFAIPEIPLQNLMVTNQAESQETFLQGDQEWTLKTFSYKLTPKGTGEGEMGPFSITYINPQSGAKGEFQVSALKLKISPKAGNRNFLLLLFVSAAVLGGAGIALTLWQRLKPRKPAPQTSPQEIAVTMMKNRIQSANLSSQTAVTELDREFCGCLKEIYGFNPASGSEQETAEQFKEKGIPADEIKTVNRLLEQIREIKYTGKNLSETEFQILKREILSFIDSKQIATVSSLN